MLFRPLYCIFVSTEKRVIVLTKECKLMNETKKYVCDVCGYEYDPALGDPENGIQPRTPFSELPEDWVCPLCGVGKNEFSAV